MSKKTFEQFISMDETGEEHERIDWSKALGEWIDSVDSLYRTVEEYLEEYVGSGKVRIEYAEKSIFEEHVGRYTVGKMKLSVSGRAVELDPVGTEIIGAKGRVDIVGAYGKARLLLVDRRDTGPSSSFHSVEDDPSPAEWTWKVATAPPRILYVELDQEVFLDTLMEVLNG